MGPQFRVSSESLEKPKMVPTTPGLEGPQLNHHTTTPQRLLMDHNDTNVLMHPNDINVFMHF